MEREGKDSKIEKEKYEKKGKRKKVRSNIKRGRSKKINDVKEEKIRLIEVERQ